MPRMAAVVRVKFELNQGQSENVALNAGIGALKLAIERGLREPLRPAYESVRCRPKSSSRPSPDQEPSGPEKRTGGLPIYWLAIGPPP